jgi:putative MATE family efflux protein
VTETTLDRLVAPPTKPMPQQPPSPQGQGPRAFILHGPIVPGLMKLGLPTLVVITIQTMVGIVEAYFVSFLGTDALAGVAVVFPVLMLMQMMANGGFGGGVASAISRAVGAGRTEDAQALAFHALVLATVLGGAFMVAALAGGDVLYRALGANGGALDAALAYSHATFIGSIPIWLTALLAAVMRGAGDVRAPAIITLVGAVVLVVLSPALIFGFGPLPRLGVAGGGIAIALFSAVSALAMIVYLRSGRAGLRLSVTPLRWRLFKDILGVGSLSALGTVQTNLTVALVTGAVGLYGTEAIAGYGIASRLDYLLIPLLFGFGTGTLTMVGTAMGAGDLARARRVAIVSAAIGAAATGLIGMVVAIAPNLWLKLFTSDPAVLATGAQYLRTVAPFYAFFGAGMMLYFASQGAKRVTLPFFGGTARLILAGGIGWYASARFGLGLPGLFAIVAAAQVMFALVSAITFRPRAWRKAA